MARLLEQGNIHCGNCGHYLWTYEHKVYNVDTQIEEQREKVSFCARCEPKTYIQMLKSADKIIPNLKDERGDRQKP